ncbi:MAG: phosphate acyltransferase PlsX [Longimicrobiaceae bacterium]
MRIALDAMGSDRAPVVEVEGAAGALERDDSLTVVLVGDREVVERELDRHPEAPRGRMEVVHAPERIGTDEPPAQAVRRKRDSSIVRGLSLVKNGEADAFISAGSTGAVMAGAFTILRPLPGVDRPAIGTAVPTAHGRTLILDSGANVDTRGQHLVQFAHLGAIYAQDLMGVEQPRIGLLNIGEEPEKGDERSLEAHRLLAAAENLHFVGNVEGRDLVRGACDVLVCDGFVGNVLLKFYESVAAFLLGMFREQVGKSNADVDLRPIVEVLDYTETGGAPLLGVDGVTIVCHGGSPPQAVKGAIAVAARAVEHRMIEHIEGRLARFAAAPVGS